ncbi:serine protease [Streptomyces sp. NBC_01795]|nr:MULTISPECIES: serine protease [unclassified Streptomyces]WSA92043.1 serine protease [Streptomyces sp. NBC_01795]WSS15316.1 serine protease [Streptomyces sp. NBC_01186]
MRGRPTLVRICDLAGRPRGTGFQADDLGTLVTSHEAVDGLVRAVVHAGERSCLAEIGDITPLPEWDLALIRTQGLGLAELVIGGDRAHPGGGTVELWTDEPLKATLVGTTAATYTSTERYHPLEQVLELALPEAASVQLRLSRRASGAPVLDAATGAVLGVLGTALHAPGRTSAFAVPLYAAGVLAPEGPLGVLLRRNGASLPGFGPDLNLAGALQLTATSVGPAAERCAHAVTRPDIAAVLDTFANGAASVLGLVGDPGTGRTTELAAFAARRARGAAPAPTVWLRGADLRDVDGSVREAVGRALATAGRVVAASHQTAGLGTRPVGDPHEANPDVIARVSRAAGRPLLVLLDSPEEMPPQLAHRLRRWTTGTASWLRAAGARMAVACRPEYWEHAGALFPRDMLHEATGTGAGTALRQSPGEPLAACVRIGDLPEREAARARTSYGLPDGALAPGDEGHPLAMRMLAQVRAAQGGSAVRAPHPARADILSAYLDLLCLRIALRLGAGERPEAGTPGAVRRLAARVAGQLHEAARRCLGPGQGELKPAVFEEIFPWSGGWASAVLAEGALAPAGDGYRFADEEFADWLQGRHLELDVALDALVHHRSATALVPVPRHRIGPVVESLLLCGRRDGPEALAPRLERLAGALGAASARGDDDGDGDGGGGEGGGGDGEEGADGAEGGDGDEAVWWAAHLLGETLLRVPDARPYTGVLRALAGYVAPEEAAEKGPGSGAGAGGALRAGSVPGPGSVPRSGFGPWFWRRLPLPVADKAALMRLLLPADAPFGEGPLPGCPDAVTGDRFLDVLGELLAAEPATVQPLLCEWFSDPRPLRQRTDREEGDGALAPTVATAAQALLYTHRGRALDELLEALIEAAHPHADELLGELVLDEPSAVCRAVDRWARDTREERRDAAATYGLRAARRVRTDADREPLRGAALSLLRHRGDSVLGDAALALLVRDPVSRTRYVDAALQRFAETGDPELAAALGTALVTHPEPVFAAFHALLAEPMPSSEAAQGQALWALAQVRTPALASRAAVLVREHAALGPGRTKEAVAGYVGRRLGHGPAARAVLRPLVTDLLRDHEAPLRASLARVLGAGEGPLRDELLDLLLAAEHELPVLETALDAVVRGGRQRRAGKSEASGGDGRFAASGGGGRSAASGGEGNTGAPGAGAAAEVGCWPEGELVRRIGLRMAVTPQGAACFDRALVSLARELPGFAAAVRAWATGAPDAWAVVVGPSARRMCDALDARV